MESPNSSPMGERTTRIDEPHRHAVETPGGDAARHSDRTATSSEHVLVGDSAATNSELRLLHREGGQQSIWFEGLPDAWEDHADEPFQAVRRHANQLAELLRRRHRELQEHEALLAEREHQIEQQLQAAQDWAAGEEQRLAEQRQDLASHQQHLTEREQSLKERCRAVEIRETQLQHAAKSTEAAQRSAVERQQELESRESWLQAAVHQVKTFRSRLRQRAAAIAQVENETDAGLLQAQQQWQAKQQAADELLRLRRRGVELRRRAVERQAADVVQHARVQATALVQREQELQRQRQELEYRWKVFREAESALAQERAEVTLARGELQNAIAQRLHEREAERLRTAEAQKSAESELRRQQQAVEERTARLDARQRELDRLQVKLHRAQQETLEMRLATEEIWGQLSGVLPAAALTKSVGRLRNRLADQFRLAAEDLLEQREAIELSRARLEDQLARLVEQRTQLQQWLQRRQQELQMQAEGLAAKEQELVEQEMHLESLRGGWQAERARYQREIRHLLTARDTVMV